MRSLYFTVVVGLIIFCLSTSFLLLFYSPSYQNKDPVASNQYSVHLLPIDHQLMDPETEYVAGRPVKPKDGQHEDRSDEHQVGPLKIDLDTIGQAKIADSHLMFESWSVGLTFRDRQFFLSEQPFKILSGSVHYFRVLPEQWRDRLLKLKACGLNTIETYVPWNLHEPVRGRFYFDGILDLRAFLKLAGELGLYVILRPGPYICSEIDFGGLPGWLLEDKNMEVRSNYSPYLKAVKLYFDVLLPKVLDLQFSRGGPIIMVQVENEYAVYGPDIQHLKVLTYMLRSAGIKEMLVTSDNSYTDKEMLFHQYALPTSNAHEFSENDYNFITGLNPHFPFMIMELWTGWFDSWGQAKHSERSAEDLVETIKKTLSAGGSFNLYMFHGGTNFGFHAGAINLTKYSPFVTSYDYDALLSEAGDITPKYTAVRAILLEFYKSLGFAGLPNVPPDSPKMNYGVVEIQDHIDWLNLFDLIPVTTTTSRPDFMESYATISHSPSVGYIIYSHAMIKFHLSSLPGVQLTGFVKDRLLSILNGRLFYILHGENSDIDPFIDYDWEYHFMSDHYEYYNNPGRYYDQVFKQPHWYKALVHEMMRTVNRTWQRMQLPRRLDLVVENQGRISYSPRRLDLFALQRKGLSGPVFRPFFENLEAWQIRLLTFSREQIVSFSNSTAWSKSPDILFDKTGKLKAPMLFRAFLDVAGQPKDTYIYLQGWTKGVVIVNQFLLGRYWKIGPQRSLYLPAPLLREGKNEILIFEEENPGDTISFEGKPTIG